MDVTFKEIKRKRIYEEVLTQIHEHLTRGDFEPGQKLPTERELAKMFNVNRLSIREALTILEVNGLVERKVGEGTFSKCTPSFTATPLVRVITKNKHLVREPMQVRRVIEPQLARLAALNITDDQLQELSEILQQQKEQSEQGRDTVDLDQKFHIGVAKATNNNIFAELIEALHKYSIGATHEKSNIMPGGSLAGYNGHCKILAAIKLRDPNTAEEEMLIHMAEVERYLLSYLEKHEANDAGPNPEQQD
jgi:DNA-binding FadR family transcriptional regulator